METSDNQYKIILSCDKQGVIKRIFLDTGSLLENIELPVGFHTLVSQISIKGLSSFWLSITEKSMADNILLTLSYNNRQINFIFSGYLLEESVLLCGNADLTSRQNVFEEIMLINNEQANQIRLSEKKAGNFLKKAEKQELNQDLLNDFSSLNNELINNKRELIHKNQKIELLNKELNDLNENMRTFTYSVSHDLKEPVGIVKSVLTLLRKKYGQSLDQKGQNYIDMALEGSNRLSKMMTDLLEYHQSSDLSISDSVDLNHVLLDVKYILQNEIALKNVQITSQKLPIVEGSYEAYRQIFQNLITNAIKFVPEGRTPIITINLDEFDTYSTINVEDNGIGIAENKRQEVFNLFKRLHSRKQYEGNGMGLAMVKKSIERMGGEIWLESEEGTGSKFYFTIKKL